MQLSSKLLEDAVDAFASLPGIGRRTALRLVLHLINQPKETTEMMVSPIARMREHIKFCRDCYHISDGERCHICSNPVRDRSVICVVESVRDVMAIEETGQYKGLYHVLGGVISPLNGIGPDALHIDDLRHRAELADTKEVIMAISPTMEGETTIFYLSQMLETLNVTVSTIARGVSFGGELEYADEVTLGRSILARTPYEVNNGHQ